MGDKVKGKLECSTVEDGTFTFFFLYIYFISQTLSLVVVNLEGKGESRFFPYSLNSQNLESTTQTTISTHTDTHTHTYAHSLSNFNSHDGKTL